MNAITAFILGLLGGWIIEWIVDWLYWRRRTGALQEENRRLRDQLADAQESKKEQEILLRAQLGQAEEANQEQERRFRADLAQAEERNRELERQIAVQAAVPAGVPERLAAVETGADTVSRAAVVPIEQDDLILINGIGPVIAGKLGLAGIRTFEQLGHLTAEELRGIVGDSISRLANEDDLIAQARHFAAQKRARG
jgi:predicted flap endonuclease-1-like 5' DNA nuclease